MGPKVFHFRSGIDFLTIDLRQQVDMVDWLGNVRSLGDGMVSKVRGFRWKYKR